MALTSGRAPTRWATSAGRALILLLPPWRAASVLFISRDSPVEREGFLGFAYWARPALGLICIIYAAIRFHVAAGPGTQNQQDLAALTKLALGIVGVLVLSAVLIFTTRPEIRLATSLRMIIPLRAIAVFIPVTALLLHWMPLGSQLNIVAALALRPLIAQHAPAALALSATSSLLRLWALIFSVIMLWAAPRHLFRIADAHPLLPPLLGAWIAWTFAIPRLGALHFSDSSQRTAAVLALGAPLSLTTLGLIEIAWLRRCKGVTFRSGPWPPSTPRFPNGTRTEDR